MKQKNKNKYYYSELEDKAIVSNIQADFERRQNERRPYELNWELNMNFYLGNQYSYISNAGEISDIEKNYFWENREVFNHIAPIVETRLAKLSKIEPNLNVRPSGNSDNDLSCAKISKSILQNAIDQNSLKNLISTATLWSEVTGTSFYKITWDNSKGNILGTIDGKVIKSGDVNISVCSPFEIYPDSNGTFEIEDCDSIIEAKVCPVKVINEIYKTNLVGSDIDIFELGSNSFLSGISGRSNVTKIAHSKKHDHVLILQKYEKPSQKHPNGKFTIVSENKLLYDGDLPYANGKNGERTFPFVKQISSKQLSSFWGASIIERIIPLQRSYNAIKNKKHEFIERLSSGVLSVEDGSVDIENLEDEGLCPGKILVYRNGSTPPKFMESGNIPTELENEEEKLLDEMNNLSSISDVSTNTNIPSGITSGTALTLLIEQDESKLSLVAENIRHAIKSIGTMILKLYKQFANELRLTKITDNNGSVEIFYWNQSNITSDDVILDSSNELGSSSSEKKEIALKLFDKGILFDQDGSISYNNKTKLLTILGFENWEISESLTDLHKKRAMQENLNLTKLEDPLEIDNHEIHISEHTKFLISEKQKDMDKTIKNKILEHIKKHKKLLKENEE